LAESREIANYFDASREILRPKEGLRMTMEEKVVRSLEAQQLRS
jgi:hypothetical protein